MEVALSMKWVALTRAFGGRTVGAGELILLRLRGGLLSRFAGARCRLAGLLWQQDGLNVRQDATLGDGHTAEQFVQLFVVAYSQLKMPRDDTSLLVVPSGVTSQLQDLSGEILQDGSQVHWSSSADSFSVVTLAEETMDAANGKLQPGAGTASLGFSAGFACGFASSRHGRLSCLP